MGVEVRVVSYKTEACDGEQRNMDRAQYNRLPRLIYQLVVGTLSPPVPFPFAPRKTRVHDVSMPRCSHVDCPDLSPYLDHPVVVNSFSLPLALCRFHCAS